MNTLLTDSISEHSKTGITDKTNIVSNSDFLCAIFGIELDECCPIIVSFAGNPNSVPCNKWFGRALANSTDATALAPNANNYFSLAKFRADEGGQYRRKKAYFQGLYAVMLDDIGSKVPIDRITLQPSWLLETSPGNYQAGYILDEPITDPKVADKLMDAIIAAGLCDAGANGPTSRLARLPVAVNGKHEVPFSCQLKEWLPELRYSQQALIDGLQLEIIETKRAKRDKPHAKKKHICDDDTVWIPSPEENVVLTTLRQMNLYKTPSGGGKHDITCPWTHEHTGAVDNGTAYFEPSDNWPMGGFKCQHAHCVKRHIRDLLVKLNIDVASARMKPIIRIIAGEIHHIVDAAERELAHSGEYYQRGGLIVTIYSDPCLRDTRIQEISQPSLVRALAGVATWERYDARAKGWVRTDPPARHSGILFYANGYGHLPVLNGLARQPYLRQDGSLMSKVGYDLATGMFGVFDERKFSIPENPTRLQAEEAFALLQEILAEFMFADDHDKAAALAAILTAVIRPSLHLAPMFHVRAHTVGSGKTYLCELFTAFATPQRGTPTTFPADDEECRKLLLATLLHAPAVIEFDNLTSDLLAHKSLCTALTSEFISGRILGLSKTASVNTHALILSSGNNVGPIHDMARRCITINLDPMVEMPATLTFKRPDLVREILQERERYVSAVLTIIRAWIVAGRPKTECKALGSYGAWSDLCRQPLLWLGCCDPATSVFKALAEDPDRETLARFLHAWHLTFGKTPMMVREAVDRAHTPRIDSDRELKEVMYDIAEERGELNRRKLGWWIRRHVGRVIDGLRFVRCSGNSSAEKWRVESVL